MSSSSAARRASYADLADLPENVVGEIIGGVLEVSPRPAPRHAVAHAGVSDQIGTKFNAGRGGPGGWWILTEPELHLGSDVLVPDLAGWRRERLPEMPSTAYFELPPDWICEIVSPSTARLDRVLKLPVYGRAGVAWAWLVDPNARSLEVYRGQDGTWVLHSTHSAADIVRADPFAAVEVDLLLVWGETREAAPTPSED